MNKLPEPLTKEEEVELSKLIKQIFGKSIFAVVDIDREKPEIKRFEELLSKKSTFVMAQNRVLKQMRWN